MNKTAKAARAQMAVQIRAAREAMPEPITCQAAYEQPVRDMAIALAREAIVQGFSFGNS